jgi:hypothetical protein
MNDYELQFGDVNDFAHQIRELIGTGDFDKVRVVLPEFDRADGKIISIKPKDAAWLDNLKNAPPEILQDIGMQHWEENIWLFPSEWYDHIPDGYDIVTIWNIKEQFHKGVTSDDRRFGALAYGILVSEEI